MGLSSRSKAKDPNREPDSTPHYRDINIIVSIVYIAGTTNRFPDLKSSKDILALGHLDLDRKHPSNVKGGVGSTAQGFPVHAVLTDRPRHFDDKGDPEFDWFRIAPETEDLSSGHSLANHTIEITIEPKELAALVNACEAKKLSKLEFEGVIKLADYQLISTDADMTKVVKESDEENNGSTLGRLSNIVRVSATTIA